MSHRTDTNRELRATLGAVALAACCLAFAVGINLDALASQVHQVRQKSRAFAPGNLVIARGDQLRILNDDGELLHHAFVRHPRLNFDSGEQEPGTAVLIRFPVAGEFTVLCDIHPRMRLVVTVK
jgi:plastocyanin